jgi:hypothetical protein
VPPAHAHRGRLAIIIEYLQTSAKAFARDVGGKDVDFGADLGSDLDGRISVSGERITVPLEIDRNDLAQWQDKRGLSKRNTAGVDKSSAE